MLPQMDAISLGYFRQNMALCLKLVTKWDGNIWLMKHRRPIAAIVTMKDAHVLGEVQGRPMHELLGRLNSNLERMRAAKAVEDEYDRIKMAEGRYSETLTWSINGYHREED